MKDAYDSLYAKSSGAEETYSDDDYVRELAGVARIVNELAALAPADYAARSEDDRYYDSVYYEVYEQYLKAGIAKDKLDADPDIKGVDMARSKRLNDEFNKH